MPPDIEGSNTFASIIHSLQSYVIGSYELYYNIDQVDLFSGANCWVL